MANVNQNLRNRLNKHIQTYTRNRVNRGSANSKNFVNTINEIINVIHRGKVPGNNNRNRTRAGSNSMNNSSRQLALIPANNSNRRDTGNNMNRILNENANFRELMSTNDPERRKILLRKLQLKHHPNKGGVNGVFNRLMTRAGKSNNNRQLAPIPGNNNRGPLRLMAPNRRNNSLQLALRPGNNNRQLALRPGNNNRQLALIPGNPINRNGNTFYNAKNNQPWLKNMAQMRGAALMNNERRSARNL